MATAADDALDLPVPTCPEWDVAALVGHTGGVHRRITEVLATNGPATSRPAPPERRADLLAWYRSGVAELAGRLSDGDPDAECWTWAGPRTRWWWCRRMSAETAVHRVDAQLAVPGVTVDPVDTAVAIDGIQEYLTEFLRGVFQEGNAVRPAGSVHVHATDAGAEADGGGEWWLDFAAPDLAAERQHRKADTAVRGPASDLLLWLWNRLPVSGGRLEAFGSADTLDRLGRLKL